MEDREYQAMFDVEQTHWWFVARRMFVKAVLDGTAPGDRNFLGPLLASRSVNGSPGRTPAFKASSVSELGKRSAKILSPVAMRIADIGAGTCGMVPFLEHYGKVVGIEPNPKGRSLAKKRGITLRTGTVQSSGLRAESTDLVCFLDVLYHKGVDDTKALAEAYRILRPGGWLLITDVAFPFLSGSHDVAVAGRERYMLGSLIPKVKRAGFTVHKQSYTFFLVFPLFAAKRLIDRLLAYRKEHSDVAPVWGIANVLLIALCRLEALLLPTISYPWGSSLLIFARKT